MKKISMFLLVLVFCLCALLPVYLIKRESDVRLTKLIRQNTTSETREYLTSAHPYRYKELGFSLDDLPILTVYDKYNFTDLCDKNLDEMYDALQNRVNSYEGGAHYIVPGEKTYCISVYDPEGDSYFDYSIYGESSSFSNKPWLEDILNNVLPESILQSEQGLKDILCLDNSADYMGTVVYYVMDDGTFFTRFYGLDETGKAEVKDFSESEFRTYSKAYRESLLSQTQYDADGNTVPTTGIPSFLSFVESNPVNAPETV